MHWQADGLPETLLRACTRVHRHTQLHAAEPRALSPESTMARAATSEPGDAPAHSLRPAVAQEGCQAREDGVLRRGPPQSAHAEAADSRDHPSGGRGRQ